MRPAPAPDLAVPVAALQTATLFAHIEEAGCFSSQLLLCLSTSVPGLLKGNVACFQGAAVLHSVLQAFKAAAGGRHARMHALPLHALEREGQNNMWSKRSNWSQSSQICW